MKQKFIQFMQGRYGDDEFNRFLMMCALVLIVISLFIRSRILLFLYMLVLTYCLYRSMSRNIVARSIENQKYNHQLNKVYHTISAKRKDHEEKDYKHFVCPKCTQIVRVPKNRGELEIKCPTCHEKFVKRT